jgi:HJR/Mrr/RecB family endonuclease
MHNAKLINNNSIRQYLHNAETQNCPRQVIVTNAIIDQNVRGQILRAVSTKIELVDLLFLKHWLSKIETSIDKIDEVSIIFKAVNDQIAKLIAENPNKLLELEWRDTERLVADVLSEFGFEVKLTPASKDGGKDIILECFNKQSRKSYIVEIKHWRSGQRVGSSLIKDFINVIINEKRDKGLYISSFGYTDNAFESLTEIDRQLVKFSDRNKIVGLCKLYTKKRTGIWLPEFDKEQILFEETF